MNIARKIAIYVALFPVAALIAGVYGMLHNQISYSFSFEYFSLFKFNQFAIPWAQEAQRLGAAYVGFLSTWWMGLLVFTVLGFFGFLFPSPQLMARKLVTSFLVVVVTALLTGLIGLAYAYTQVTESTLQNYSRWLPEGTVQPLQFVRVGFMHNASYLGGLVGLLAGVVYLVVARVRSKKR